LLYQNIKDKKLKSRIKKTENRFQDAAEKAEKLEMILPEEVGYLEAEGMEKTYNFRQEDLAKNVDINTSKKVCLLIHLNDNIGNGPLTRFIRSSISTSKILVLTLLIIPVMEG
jgi:hypothetical protein